MNFPALELIWSPTGLGSVVNGHGWPLRGVHPLGEAGLTFGIEGNVRLRYPPSSEGREICKIEKRHGAIRLWHMLRKHHCAVNGRWIEEQEVELHHRDVIAFPSGPVFRVLEQELNQARSPSLEAALRAAPGDRELLHVYGDFLLDHGDPLGERLARARSAASTDDSTWLDVLALHHEAGRLGIEWENGLAVKVVLREALATFRTLEQALGHLCALPVMRFLRHLTVDVASDKLAVGDALHALAAVKLPETCQVVSLGDVPQVERERVMRLLDAAPGRVEVGFYSEACLEVLSSTSKDPQTSLKTGDIVPIGTGVELGRSDHTSHLGHNVLLGGSHLVLRDSQRFLLKLISGDGEPAKVNGRVVDRFPLRDGDLIELVGELTARFKLVR